MLDVIARRRAEIAALCEQMQIRRLWVSGSALLGRSVDLTSIRGVRNPLLRAELEATRQPISVAA